MNTIMENVARELENVEVTTVNKNGVEKDALVVKIGNVGATIYEESFAGCRTTEDGIALVNQVIEAHRAEMSRIGGQMDFFTDYENIKGLLKVRLLSNRDQAEVFRKADARGFKGLKIVPYVDVPEEIMAQKGSIKVKKSHVELWGVTEKEVIDQALNNTKGTESSQSLSGFMADVTGEDWFEQLPEGPMIVSNKERCFGASAILGLIPEFKKKYTEGFFILPSSIHEVLLMPKGAGDFTLEGLTAMVREVNATAVVPEEQLADVAFEF